MSFDENYPPDEDFNFSDLNYCQRIQSFTIKQLEDCNVPILPSLTELHLVNDDRVDLSNQSCLFSIIEEGHCNWLFFYFYSQRIVKDRDVTFNIDEDEGLEEVDVLMEEDEEEKQFSDNYYLYDEDEVTVYAVKAMRKKEKRMIKLMLDIALCCSCSLILSIGV